VKNDYHSDNREHPELKIISCSDWQVISDIHYELVTSQRLAKVIEAGEHKDVDVARNYRWTSAELSRIRIPRSRS
jgi:hypothetical protein